MMVSVGLGRASRGLTAIPSMRRADRNRGVPHAAAQRSAGRLREGFLAREERRLQHRPEKWEPVFGTADAPRKCRRGEETRPTR
ncbi:hypothetical protein N181_13145 [Sinorhizobium fredii USDA 205]|uniref:Uncharacterized protein n=1 Tax=Sinorhizobium glycinis TaxID=1472378 RepID=A0A178XLU2_9HYPH|nr:hypothetical protein N181_13145 [Sinorhizobium fredii USDA 205]OAP35545.1 hypothetical protein AU381_11530 [Sinorhizobium glycinis]CEO91243.1 hypothetical protein predicted by Glimmer/Critica [Sinorhizobium fredii HH103]